MKIFVDLFQFFINFIITHSFRFISLCSLIEYLVSDYVVSLCNYVILQNFFEFRSHPYFLLFFFFIQNFRFHRKTSKQIPIGLCSWFCDFAILQRERYSFCWICVWLVKRGYLLLLWCGVVWCGVVCQCVVWFVSLWCGLLVFGVV